MAYPHAVAAANELIDAALRFEPSLEDTDDGMVEAKWDEAIHFRDACANYRAAADREHVRGPDMDADHNVGANHRNVMGWPG